MKSRDEARALTYRLLGAAFLYPADVDWKLFSDSFPPLVREAIDDLGLDVGAELDELEANWVYQPDDHFLHLYTELFVNSPRGILAPLNEALYFDDGKMVNTLRTQQVSDAYAAFGFTPASEYQTLLPDHLALELEFMALGLLQDTDMQNFFIKHVYSWQPQAAQRVIDAQLSPFYSAMAQVLIRFLDWENQLISGGVPQAVRVRTQ